MVRVRKSNRSGALPRTILPLQSQLVAASMSGFLPTGAILVSIKGENPSGPTWSCMVNQMNYTVANNILTYQIIQRNGVAASSIHHSSFMTNVSANPTVVGDQALQVTADASSSLTLYYMT